MVLNILIYYKARTICSEHLHRQPRKGHTLLACSMVCNMSWHLPWILKLVWHPARLIKEGGCVQLSMDTMHLKDPLVLFRSEGSALSFSLSSFTYKNYALSLLKKNDKGPLTGIISYGTKLPLCADVPLDTHSLQAFIFIPE